LTGPAVFRKRKSIAESEFEDMKRSTRRNSTLMTLDQMREIANRQHVPLPDALQPVVANAFSFTLSAHDLVKPPDDMASSPSTKDDALPSSTLPSFALPNTFWTDSVLTDLSEEEVTCASCHRGIEIAPFLSCDMCTHWYHGVCVGVDVGKLLGNWSCLMCVQKLLGKE
jgi:hypothetical protein